MLREYGRELPLPDDGGTLATALRLESVALRRRLRLREEPFVVRSEGNTAYVAARGVSGSIRVGGTWIDVLPKFARQTDGARWRDALLNVLARADETRAYALPAGALGRTGPAAFVDHVGATFAVMLRDALATGPIRTYRAVIDRGNAVAGRLLFGSGEIVAAIRNPGTVTYELDRLDVDNAFNALLLAAANHLASSVRDPVVRSSIRTAAEPIVLQRDVRRTPLTLPPLPRQFDAYRGALSIALDVLGGRASRCEIDGVSGFALLVATDRVFETFVERTVMLAAERIGHSARPQAGIEYAAPCGTYGPLVTRPDVVVSDEAGAVQLVVDAKYKVPHADESRVGDSSDYYQLLTSMIAHDCSRGVILYPAEPGAPNARRSWSVTVGSREYELHSAPLDVAAFADAGGRETVDASVRDVLAGILRTGARAA